MAPLPVTHVPPCATPGAGGAGKAARIAAVEDRNQGEARVRVEDRTRQIGSVCPHCLWPLWRPRHVIATGGRGSAAWSLDWAGVSSAPGAAGCARHGLLHCELESTRGLCLLPVSRPPPYLLAPAQLTVLADGLSS